jgi:hypothetical protein
MRPNIVCLLSTYARTVYKFIGPTSPTRTHANQLLNT